ncbi:hypothetical protein M0804_006733 [Polistes exclamans]|nr:hypothetical protein M0804_006733 [Polistes exclamans]
MCAPRCTIGSGGGGGGGTTGITSCETLVHSLFSSYMSLRVPSTTGSQIGSHSDAKITGIKALDRRANNECSSTC